MHSASASSGRRLPLAGLVHLFVTYIVWGSTYLAIRVAVREGAGWGPFWLGASRILIAGGILLLFCALRGKRLRPTGSELLVLTISGLLMWIGGNGGVNWAEQRVDSGLAALVVGTMPIWVAMMAAVIDRRPPSLLLIGSLVAGFLGVGVLTAPMIAADARADAVGLLVVMAAAICWGAGSLLLRRRPVKTAPLVTSGLQQLIGGIGFVFLAAAAAEPLPQPVPVAWIAWAYLVIFGSLLAFSSYIRALELLPTSVVMTYTYVNPVIAVLLGWLILSEPITWVTVAGMILILAGVVGVFRDKTQQLAS